METMRGEPTAPNYPPNYVPEEMRANGAFDLNIPNFTMKTLESNMPPLDRQTHTHFTTTFLTSLLLDEGFLTHYS